MRPFFFNHPRAYRLKPIARREGDTLSLIRIAASNRNILVPYSPGLEYIVASSGGAALPIWSADFRVDALGAWQSLWARLRLAFIFKKGNT